MKTLAVRLDDDLHARLGILAKLADMSVTEAIRLGIEKQVAEMAADTELSAKAEGMRAAIAEEAAAQAAALSALFGEQPARKSSSPRKTAG